MGSYSAEEYFYKVDNMVLSSCQQLRKLFQTRWKKETGREWEHTEEQGKIFIEGLGKTVFKKANKLQKAIIAKGCLDEWDMTTLSMVLQNFGDQTEFEAENGAVKGLTRLRNDLAHHSTKKLTLAEYNLKVESFRKSLLAICVKKEDIEKLIEKAGITSSVAALEATKKLYEQVEELLRNECIEKAIEHLNEATTMTSLLPVHHGVAHEKRAECYMKLARVKNQNQMKDEGDSCCEQAMIDATIALELNDSSWNAHYLIGQCHRWQNNFQQAIQHYQKALAISPVQKQVKTELDVCKALVGRHSRQDNLDPRCMPLNLEELFSKIKAETGVTIVSQKYKDYYIEYKECEARMFKGQTDVFRGHQYAMGWVVSQNDEEAARHYAKGAKLGNPEGIYNLGLCYSRGVGVKTDLEKAYQLILQAAQMSPDTPGIRNTAGKNVGVASAQHTVGLWHEEGIFVEQDFRAAFTWYTKSVENGCGNAANNLAHMYASGQGVQRNEKKAEMHWNQAVIWKDPNAAESLIKYYLDHMEPEKARNMLEIGKTLGSVGLNDIGKVKMFNSLIQEASSSRMQYEDAVIEYEKKHQLLIKGLTFLERCKRWMHNKYPKTDRLFRSLQNIKSNKSWGGKIGILGMSEDDWEYIGRRAYEGSISANQVMTATNAALYLAEFIKERNEFNENDKMYAMNLLYECCTAGIHVAAICIADPLVKDKLKAIITELFQTKCTSKGEEDMKIRFSYVCYVASFAMKSTDTFMMGLLKEGIRMYPDNLHYYDLVSCMYGQIEDYKSGLYFAEKGLEKFPDDVDLLYSKAVHLRLLSDSNEQSYCLQGGNKLTPQERELAEQSIAAFEDFLKKAEKDHRKRPEAFYSLASLSFSVAEVNTDHLDSRVLKNMEYYFKLGNDAETNMLPCYLPYGESDNKLMVETLLLMNAEFSSSPGKNCVSNPNPIQRENVAVSNTILKRKQYLAHPMRKLIVQAHRQMMSTYKMKDLTNAFSMQRPDFVQMAPKRMSLVRSITLKEMDPTSDHIYENRMIDLTIIEDPNFCFPSIHLVAEDDNGDVTRLFLYNFERNKETQSQLRFGSTLTILNPYMRIGMDGVNGIRNDEPTCIIYLSKVNEMCRFCGEENAPKKCSRCKTAVYCSKECQELDWTKMKHKLICSK